MVWGHGQGWHWDAHQCPNVAQHGSQQLSSEAKQAIPSKGAYLLEATERGHGHPTHCRGSSAEWLPT